MISVVIADDSLLLRRMLKEALEQDAQVRVVGQAQNGVEAIERVRELKPDILILDCEMPLMNGLEALRRIMAECPLPVFMFSSLTWEGAGVTIKALEYGAIDFLLKPAREDAVADVAQELLRRIKFIVIRSKFRSMAQKDAPLPPVPREPLRQRNIDLIAMGSSTGGVQAAMNVIPFLPATVAPIVWVQHMPAGFTKSFAERLDGVSQVRVSEAVHGESVLPGHCYLAAGGFQMRVRGSVGRLTLCVESQEKVSGHCPSCNVLFESVAQISGQAVLGIILTGMGDDGAQAMKRLHDRGAYVIGQNEQSCVVYGMPKAAYQAGAVDSELDIREIAGAIKKIGGWA